ncbi:MAG: hypothetical protein Q4G68_10800 [Planctomycetia bacterium]|nr:hypothetical protein [Planctomycetia bacterium]
MKVKKEHFALLGVLLLILGVEMVIVKQVVLNDMVSRFILQRFYDDSGMTFMVEDDSGTIGVRRINVPVPDTLGHCVATSGLVLLLCCYVTFKDG